MSARLAGAWSDAGREDALRGLDHDAALEDPFVRVVRDADLDAVRVRLVGVPIFAFRWQAGVRDDRRPGATGIGLVASADPIDAVVAVGVASPEHGIGTAAMVRFVTTLRGMCERSSIERLAEDLIELALVPKSRDAGVRVAARACELCAPLAAGTTVDALATAMRAGSPLVLDWR